MQISFDDNHVSILPTSSLFFSINLCSVGIDRGILMSTVK